MQKKKLLFIFGTRPEAIKMAPLIKLAKENSYFNISVCATAQHRQMLDPILGFFGIVPDDDLDLMQPNQDLFGLTQLGLAKLKTIIQAKRPDLILVQGDTASAFIGALAGFYCKIKIAHIEAGLRSHTADLPYPEAMYRILIGQLAEYHFAPTYRAKLNLTKENISNNVYVVGNTIIDALLVGLNLIKNNNEKLYYDYFSFLNFEKKIILITGHRRENFGGPLQAICRAISLLAQEYTDVQFVYPVHLNPNVQIVTTSQLANIANVFLIEPLNYPYFIWLMTKSYLIITDSGGTQEEAPSLGKPVLVTRHDTERMEGIEAGIAKLVGTSIDTILIEVKELLDNKGYYHSMSTIHNPYGHGNSCKHILKILQEKL